MKKSILITIILSITIFTGMTVYSMEDLQSEPTLQKINLPEEKPAPAKKSTWDSWLTQVTAPESVKPADPPAASPAQPEKESDKEAKSESKSAGHESGAGVYGGTVRTGGYGGGAYGASNSASYGRSTRMVNSYYSAVSAPPDKQWISKTKRSIAIMCKIIDDLLGRELSGSDYEPQGMFKQGCRGFWIPNTGLHFNLQVGFPLRYSEMSEEENKENEKDLWDQYEGELVMQPFGGMPTNVVISKKKTGWDPFVQGDTEKLDKEKIETLKKTVIGAIAKYGYRFEGFKDDEIITIVVSNPQSNMWTGFGGFQAPSLYEKNREFYKTMKEDPKKIYEQTSKMLPDITNAKRMYTIARAQSGGNQEPEVVVVDPKEDDLKDVREKIIQFQTKIATNKSKERIVALRKEVEEKIKKFDLAKKEKDALQKELEAGTSDQNRFKVMERRVKNAEDVLKRAEQRLRDAETQDELENLEIVLAQTNNGEPVIVHSQALKKRIEEAKRILESRKKDLELNSQRIEIAEKNLKEMKLRYESGMVSSQDVFEAEEKLLQAKKDMNEAERKYMEAEKDFQESEMAVEQKIIVPKEKEQEHIEIKVKSASGDEEGKRSILLDLLKSDVEICQKEVEIAEQQKKYYQVLNERGNVSQQEVQECEEKILKAQKNLNEAQRKLLEAQIQQEQESKEQESKDPFDDSNPPEEEMMGMGGKNMGGMEMGMMGMGGMGEGMMGMGGMGGGMMGFTTSVPNGPQSQTTMVIQIPFKIIPKESVAYEDIKDNVTITVY